MAIRLAKMGLVIENASAVAKIFRPVAIDGIVAADPLAQKVIGSQRLSVTTSQQAEAQQHSQSHTEKNQPLPTVDGAKSIDKPVKARPTLETLVINEDQSPQTTDTPAAPLSQEDLFAGVSAHAQDASQVVGEADKATPTLVTTSPSKAASNGKQIHKATKQPSSTTSLREAIEVSYADIVPADLRGKLKPFSAEILGKVIAWANEPEKRGKWMVRTVDKGIAVEKDMVFDFSNKAVDAVMSWAEAGWLYIDLSRPGMKFHSVAKTEGGADICSCVIFTSSAATRLGMKDVG